jgi:translation initiation factor RLI1
VRDFIISGPICTHAGIIEGSFPLKEGEVVLLQGENGIGKSSLIQFIKMNKNLRDNFQISFSDQFPLRSVNNIQVSVFLEMLAVDFKSFHQLDIFDELKLLLDKTINDLSGGENQLLKLLITLSFDMDAYILDEPSTFLDKVKVQKLKMVLNDKKKSGKYTLIIEHRSDLFEDILDRKVEILKQEQGLVLHEL